MRFEEAYEGWQSRLAQEEAARLLGVSERTHQCYIDRYEEAFGGVGRSVFDPGLTPVRPGR